MPQLFPNPPLNPYIVKDKKLWAVTVDLDVWFEYFLRTKEETPTDQARGLTRDYIVDQLTLVEAALEKSVTGAYYRRSSKGHVHLLLTFSEEVTVFDGFILRACLYDDTMRLSLDMHRYGLHDSLEKLNKCFDEKSDNGKFYVSGPWIPLNKGRDDFRGQALVDWNEYWNGIGRQYHPEENHIGLIWKHWKGLTDKQKGEMLSALTENVVVNILNTDNQTELAV